MPGGFPLGIDLCAAQNVGAATATSKPAAMTAGAANVKGAWVQLVASTTGDCCQVVVYGKYYTSGTNAIAIDVGIGASGSEIVLIPNLVIQNPNATFSGMGYTTFPIAITAGTRVAARCQTSLGSDNNNGIDLIIFDGSFTQMPGCAGVNAVGFNSATTLGTSVNPGVTINTKGVYSQLTASTVNGCIGFFLAIDSQNVNSAAQWLIDIAIGAGGSEVVILPNAIWESGAPMWTPFFGIGIQAGTRIAARCQSSIASALIGVTLYAVYQ